MFTKINFFASALICGAAMFAVSCNKDEKPVVYVPEDVKTAAESVSEKGTANCYIVKPNSTVSFSVAYKGNSTTEEVGDAVSVKLIWQSAAGLVKALYLDPDTKVAYAEISEASGNAVVAACDAAGTALWSWHLWASDYDPSASLYTTEANEAGTTWSFMDRNIGALSTEQGSVDSYGLIYQWGRKDPFPAAKCYTIINEDYSYQEDGEPELYDIDGNVLEKVRNLAEYHGTIEKSVQQPLTFFAMTYAKTGEVDEDGNEVTVCDYITKDWVDVSNDDYWGGVSLKKTIYDPCPVGYKVPVCDEAGNSPYAWMVYTDMTWDTTKPGALIKGVWFPAAGTRVYASGGLDLTEANPYGGVWFGNAGATSSVNEVVYGQYMAIMKSKRTFKTMKDSRSQGLSVRCVAE